MSLISTSALLAALAPLLALLPLLALSTFVNTATLLRDCRLSVEIEQTARNFNRLDLIRLESVLSLCVEKLISLDEEGCEYTDKLFYVDRYAFNGNS